MDRPLKKHYFLCASSLNFPKNHDFSFQIIFPKTATFLKIETEIIIKFLFTFPKSSIFPLFMDKRVGCSTIIGNIGLFQNYFNPKYEDDLLRNVSAQYLEKSRNYWLNVSAVIPLFLYSLIQSKSTEN